MASRPRMNYMSETPAQHRARLALEAELARQRHISESLRKGAPQGTLPPQMQSGLAGASMMHPAVLFDWIANRLNKATGQ